MLLVGAATGGGLEDWPWPGLVLIGCVGAPAAIVAVGALLRRPYAHVGHPIIGAILVGWAAVQVFMLGGPSWLQLILLGVGGLIGCLGAANYRDWSLA